jgi:hypothetical protein
LWIEILNRLGLGNDLVDEIPTQELRKEFPSGPGKRDGMKLFKGTPPLEDGFQYLLNRLQGLPLDTRIMLLEYIPRVIQDDGIRADRSNINAQVKRFHLPKPHPLNKNF